MSVPSDESRENISNSAICNDDLKAQNFKKFLKIRKQLIKELCDPQPWYAETRLRKKIKYVIDKDCPYTISKNGRVVEHYWVWWKNHPNEPVKYNQEIRHINGDPTDNRIENLKLVSRKEHMTIHSHMKRGGQK